MAVGTQQSVQLLYALVNNQLPTDKYFVDRFDDDAAVKYYGFVTKCGDGWYIMRETITGDVHVFDYHIITQATQNYTTFEDAWTNRDTVDYFNIVILSGLLK
jgi:hypothetical protein